jgi:hypothetical protein
VDCVCRVCISFGHGGAGHSLIRIRLIRKLGYVVNGLDLSQVQVGETVELPDETALQLMRGGWAETLMQKGRVTSSRDSTTHRNLNNIPHAIDRRMKLIIVERSQFVRYQQLLDKFSDDLNVRVIWDRRKQQRRHPPVPHSPELRSHERRRLARPWNGRDYVVINRVVDQSTSETNKRRAPRTSGRTAAPSTLAGGPISEGEILHVPMCCSRSGTLRPTLSWRPSGRICGLLSTAGPPIAHCPCLVR